MLADVALTVESGALVHLTGANGAGKTTLMRLVARLLDPDTGDVLVSGHARYDAVAYAREIGFVAAGNTGLHARLNTRQHLEFAARLGLVEPGRRRSAIEDAVERFDLARLGAQRVDRLSMGQRQRVRLAAAFVHAPRLVMLDEPLNSLDADGATLLLREVDRHRAGGGGVLWLAPTGDGWGAHADTRLTLADARLVAA